VESLATGDFLAYVANGDEELVDVSWVRFLSVWMIVEVAYSN
jgi:hypothetical protein